MHVCIWWIGLRIVLKGAQPGGGCVVGWGLDPVEYSPSLLLNAYQFLAEKVRPEFSVSSGMEVGVVAADAVQVQLEDEDVDLGLFGGSFHSDCRGSHFRIYLQR